MKLLDNPIQAYAWGSRTAIAELQGRAASQKPEAELWMGAHPSAPSRIAGERLDEAIARAPQALLGGAVAQRFGDKLPFLLKILAANEPLSLQAHPSIADAERGFDDEDRRGVPRDAPHRSYRDRNHKPELICALTPFDALYGFRDPSKSLELFRALAVPELAFLEPLLSAGNLKGAFERIMSLGSDRERAVAALVAACAKPDAAFAAERAWAVKLAALYPADAGIISALLLNLVRLAPGDALYLPAGNLHAYLSGVGVEIMASSDNVLRGGLTKKHVDLAELLRVLDFKAIPPTPLRPSPSGVETVYVTPAPEFRLSRIAVQRELTLPCRAPEILLAIEGRVEVRRGSDSLVLQHACAAFVEPGPALQVSGRGVLFRATVNG